MDECAASSCTSLVIAPEISFRATIPDAFDVPRHDVNIICHQGVSTGGMLHTGSIIWDGSRFLASWLASGTDLGMVEPGQPSTIEPREALPSSAHPLRSKYVLELGSGVSGLPSLVSAACGAARVTATDLPEECALLQRNVECAVKVGTIPDVVDVMPLDWGEFPPSSEATHSLGSKHGCTCFDVVLAADIVYEDTWKLLARMVQYMLLSDAGTPWTADQVLMVNTNRAAVHRFRRALESAGLTFHKVALQGADMSIVAWRICATATADDEP